MDITELMSFRWLQSPRDPKQQTEQGFPTAYISLCWEPPLLERESSCFSTCVSALTQLGVAIPAPVQPPPAGLSAFSVSRSVWLAFSFPYHCLLKSRSF